MKPGLERIFQACKSLGHPERQFRSIHIAGTNGKGSTVAILHSILTEAGYKVGRFTSPHLVRVNERFVIEEEEIKDEELEEILTPLLTKEGKSRELETRSELEEFAESNSLGGGLTFFELCTLISFLHFAKHKVDIALIEVGLGGRLDSTNILTPLISVIGEIALDHTEILGSDLSSIAKEKGGIIKYKTPVVCGASDPQARKVIEGIAAEKEAPIFQVQTPKTLLGGFFDWKKYRKLQTNLQGAHQIRNAGIALTTLEILADKGYLIRESSIRRGLNSVQWPGRLEFEGRILLDGAHNPSGIASLVQFLREFQEVKKWKVLFSAVREKAVSEMLELLSSVAEEIVVCKMNNPRSIEPESAIAAVADRDDKKLQISHLSAYETCQKMVESLKSDEAVLVTGSLYLVGEIKEKLTQN